MKKKKTNSGMLPKMELLIIFVFFLSFIIWAMSKCSSTQTEYEHQIASETEQIEIKSGTTDSKEEVIKEPAKTTTTTRPEKVTVLYVVLKDLKLRKGPHLDSSIVRTLKLDSEVYFLNEVTKFKQEINLGDRIAIEPWVKVRAYSGHEGWVYGAGVNYFKSKSILDTLLQ